MYSQPDLLKGRSQYIVHARKVNRFV